MLPKASLGVVLGVVSALAAGAGCRSTSTNVTGPSSTRCAVSLSGTGLTVPGGGGTGTITVGVDRECSWSAVSESPWITIGGPASGQGPGSIAFSVPANPTASARQGGIAVGAQRVVIQQDAAACAFSVLPTSAAIGATGGPLRFTVTSLSGCTWSATSSVPWAVVTGGATGSGTGDVGVEVSPNSGAPRSGTVTIAGVAVTIAQGGGGAACAYNVSLSSSAFGAQGGNGTAAVTTAAGCEWTAASNQSWLVVGGPAGGSGNGTVTFSVSANTGPARSASLTIGGQGFTVSQAAAQSACAYSVTPGSRTVPGDGGSGTFSVTTTAGCEWSAASNVTWVSVTAGTRGNGSGTVEFSAAFNSGPARSGTLSIAGETVTVSQQATSCSYQVAPTTVSIPAPGGPSSVSVTTAPSCAWTAASGANWITLTSAASATGSGVVSFAIAANDGGAREGTLVVAGQPVTVSQGGASCTYGLSPASLSVGAAGGASSVAVSTSPGCTWTAASNDAWIAVTGGASGNGNGTVAVSVAANAGAARTGTLTIAGQSFVVSQAAASAACTYAIAPTSQAVGAGGGSVAVSVSAPGGCAWTATSNAPWVTIASGASGTGNGTVTLSVSANASTSARSGTVTIAGQSFTVQQSGVSCTYALVPTGTSVGAARGTATVEVATAAGCAWTAVSNAAWLSITDGLSGTGNGRVTYEFLANTDVQSRSGTLTIAGLTFAVTQAAAACSYAVAPTTITAVPAAGGASSVSVTTAASCAWTASSSVPWVTITSGSAGTGNGTVALAIAQNTTGAPRSGTVTVAGQTVTVNQQ